MKRLNTILFFVLIISVLGVIALFVGAWILQSPIFDSVYKLSYQFFLLVVVGGGVSLLFQQYVRDRDRKYSDREELTEVAKQLVNAYNEVKRIRRFLRARAWRSPSGIEVETGAFIRRSLYEDLMAELNSVQLKLEALKRRVQAEPQLFQETDQLEHVLDKMEKYLHGIIKEYETALRTCEEDPNVIELSQLPKLNEFIAPRMVSKNIYDGIFIPFRKGLSSLSEAAAGKRTDN